MSDHFDLHLRYPELFEPLTEEQRRNVMQPLASSWLEGDNPTAKTLRYSSTTSWGASPRKNTTGKH